MATFMLIEINCDHLEDLDNPREPDRDLQTNVGAALAQACRNPHNAARVLQENDLYRVLRVVGQTGERINANHVQNYQWLWKP